MKPHNPHDPIFLKGRAKRKRLLPAIMIGVSLFSLWVVDRQIAPGEQRRDFVFQVDGKTRPDIALTIVYLTTPGAGTWSLPGDWDNTANTVECIGGGGGSDQTAGSGSGGGGGGAYAKKTNATFFGNQAYSIAPGATTASPSDAIPGGDTWIGDAVFTSSICGAKGGTSGFGFAGGSEGQAGTSRGDVKYSGGWGGYQTGGNEGGGGGGGAGGPNGAGANGADTATNSGANGGGGGNGLGGAGGVAGAGAAGTEWDATHGSGGGGAGRGVGLSGYAAGLYGAGGGGNGKGAAMSTNQGKQGIIRITYTPRVVKGITFNIAMMGI